MEEKKETTNWRDIKYQLAGWILFVLCAILFTASSVKNHDILTFIGSVIFFIACIVFLIPLLKMLGTQLK